MRTPLKTSVFAVMLIAVLASAAAQAGTIFIFSDSAPADHPAQAGAASFAELVRERSEGRLGIELFSSGRLFDGQSAMAAAQLGGIAFCRVRAEDLAEEVPIFRVLTLPYLFRDDAQRWKILNGPIGNELLDKLTDYGLVGLTYYDAGVGNFYNSRRVVANPADLRGLRIEVPATLPMLSLIHAFGASPVTLGREAEAEALRGGSIDGAGGDWKTYEEDGRFRAAPYYTLDGHLRAPDIVCMSKLIWDTLTPEDRKLIRDAAVESQAAQRRAWNEYENQAIRAVTDGGQVTVTETPDPALWREAARPIYGKVGLGAAGEELAKRIEAIQ